MLILSSDGRSGIAMMSEQTGEVVLILLAQEDKAKVAYVISDDWRVMRLDLLRKIIEEDLPNPELFIERSALGRVHTLLRDPVANSLALQKALKNECFVELFWGKV
jgi:hypothetical protein